MKLQMPVLQCNIVQQMLYILEGLIPSKKDEEQAVSLSSKESQDGKFASKLQLTFPRDDQCMLVHADACCCMFVLASIQQQQPPTTTKLLKHFSGKAIRASKTS